MKFSAIVTAAAAAMILFAGCGEKKDSSVKTYKIGVAIPAADHGWTGGVVWHAEQAKKAVEQANPDVKVVIATAKDSSEQVDRMENLLMQDVDAFVVLPHEPSPLTGICETVKAKGKYLVIVDRGIDKKVQDVTVAGDNRGFGRASAEALVKALDGKGDIVVMEGVPCVVNSDRVEAFREVIAKHPGIKILDSQSAGWDTEKGLKLMENYLQKYPKIDAVWTGDDDVLLGALKAVEESGRKDIKLMTGGAGNKVVVKKILDGDKLVSLTVTYPPQMIAEGINIAVKALKDPSKKMEPTVIVPSEIVSRDNAAKYYFPDSVY